MAYEVLSIGDGEMLANAFQGVAMIFGNGSLEKIIKSGFLIGTMLISIKYVTDQEFPLHHVLVGSIVYSMMFVPTDTVIIEDVYTGNVRDVANVPIGVAMPMSVISTMGVKMTGLFETGFSTPSEASMLDGGYLNTLKTLVKLRHFGIGTAGSDTGMDGDLSKTINAYIENCVMYDMELSEGSHEVTYEGLQKNPNLWEAMKTTFVNIDIMTYLPGSPEGQQKSCEDAYKAITDYFSNGNFKSQLERQVSSILGIVDKNTNPEEMIDKASAALSIVGFDSQQFMNNALLASYLKDGPSAFITRPGQEQLNLQWASEQSMFDEIARPLMAFVEMFTVAISPIVAFLVTLGPIGMTMMVRYVQMMLWIALWGPLMAVCNLYITIVTTRALKVLADNAEDNGSGIMAMINHDELFHTLEIWLSTGGMLASSVPALSLMIVYGGSVAATNLSGKMTSAASSSVNPSRLIPEAVSMGSSMQIGSMSEYSANTGAKKSGVADKIIQGGSTFSRSNASAQESAITATNTLGKTISSINQATQRSGQMQSNQNAVMSGFTSSDTSASNWSDGTTRTTGEGYSLSNSEAEIVSAGAAVGAPTPAITAALESKANTSATRLKEIGDRIDKARASATSGGHQETTTSGHTNTSSSQNFSGSEEMKAQAQQFTDQATRALSATQKYSQTSAMMQQSSKSMNFEGHQFGPLLNQQGMIPDINKANEALKQKIGDQAYQKLKNNAYNEIDSSASQLLTGGDREALAGYFILDAGDPVAAADIFNKAASPTSGSVGIAGPDEYKQKAQSPDDIVSQQQNDLFKSLANDVVSSANSQDIIRDAASSGGNEPDVNISGTDGGHKRASANHPTLAHPTDDKAHVSTPKNNQVSHKPQTPAANNAPHGGNENPLTNVSPLKPAVGRKDADADKVMDHIMNDELLHGKNVHAGQLLENAGGNQIKATGDVAKHVLDSNPVQQSVDAFKNIVQQYSKERPSDEMPHIKDDDDLPPQPKD